MSDNRFSCGCGQSLWVWDKHHESRDSNAILLDPADPDNVNVCIETTDGVPKVTCGRCDKLMMQVD